jgi:hypothetical protein
MKTTITDQVIELPISMEPDVHPRAHHASGLILSNLNSVEAFNTTRHFSQTRCNIIPSPTPSVGHAVA